MRFSLSLSLSLAHSLFHTHTHAGSKCWVTNTLGDYYISLQKSNITIKILFFITGLFKKKEATNISIFCGNEECLRVQGGSSKQAQSLAYLLPDPTARGSILSISQFFLEEQIVNAAEVNQQSWFEESGHWLVNVDQTHQVLTCGKLVLQKKFQCPSIVVHLVRKFFLSIWQQLRG